MGGPGGIAQIQHAADCKGPTKQRNSGRAELTPLERDVLAELHHLHHPWMVAEARKKGLDEPDIPATDALIRALRNFKPQRGPFEPFLRVVLRGELNSAYRKQIKGAIRTQRPSSGFNLTPDHRDAERRRFRDITGDLVAALRWLPLKVRRLIQRYHLPGLTLDELETLF